jgi:hypothetical protein
MSTIIEGMGSGQVVRSWTEPAAPAAA